MKAVFVPRKRFYWRPVWMNCITWERGDPKIYRWGWWNFNLNQEDRMPSITMKFTYIEDGLPDDSIAVIAAWTNEDESEFHLLPSFWDMRGRWYAPNEDAINDPSCGYRVYAWADWADAPELPPRRLAEHNSEIGDDLGHMDKLALR